MNLYKVGYQCINRNEGVLCRVYQLGKWSLEVLKKKSLPDKANVQENGADDDLIR